MKSMTGFGSSQKESLGIAVDIAIRSVNSRFLDFKIHLPPEYQSIEKNIRDHLAGKIRRGNLSVLISRKRTKVALASETKVNFEAARAYSKDLSKLAKQLKVKDEISLEAFLQLPNIFLVEPQASLSSGETKLVMSVLAEATKNMELERIREGKSLQTALLQRFTLLEELRQKIEVFREHANSEVQIRLEKRIKELQLQTFDLQRISEEVVWLLDKGDITEELTRLKEHLHHATSLLKSEESQGKKLDFYAQELLREVNTIGSKANHSQITQVVIEAKNVIEQIKEQIQNVE